MSVGIFLGLLGFVLVPLSAQLLPATISTAPIRALGALTVAAAIARLVTEIVRQMRSAPHERAREWKANVRLVALVLFALYLFSEVTATAAVHVGGLAQPFREFRERQTLASTALAVAHPFLIMTHNPAVPGVNALGFKDRDWPVEKPAGTIRIACLGASTTDDGYPRLLSQELERRLPQLKIEVLNFANGGWTTAQTLINYVLNVRHYSPDWIILHHATNDRRSWGHGRIRTDYSDSYTILSPKPHVDAFWVRYYNSYAFGKYLLYRANGRDAGLGLYQVILRAGDTARGPPSSTDVEIFSGNLEEIAKIARAHGTKVLITTQPYSLTDLSWGAHWVEEMQVANDAIREVARELVLPLVDVDALITGKHDAFRDPIHLRRNAVEMKTRAIAEALVPLLLQHHGAAGQPN